ncbi:MAG: DUF1465 family protein [Pseudomonadota bacterium]
MAHSDDSERSAQNQTASQQDTKQGAILLAERFTRSDRFDALFSYGMDLVERTAAFLDADGRIAASSLTEPARALYGAESMRLTTRLMQIASWLLLQRAAVEGEMSREQILSEKQKVKLTEVHAVRINQNWSDLPEGFVDLVDQSIALQRRIARLDSELYGPDRTAPQDDNNTAKNAVASQLDLLKTAFG